LLRAALGLSPGERAELAMHLWESLEPDESEAPEVDAGAEILRRLSDLEAGHVLPVAWPEARARIVEDGDGPLSR
jgi:putative addiction module component (TIGR02574 family)